MQVGTMRESLSARNFIFLNCCTAPCPCEQPMYMRAKFNRDLIGLPTNFQHIGHVGGNEPQEGKFDTIQEQLQSKGGYEEALPVPTDLRQADVPLKV